MSGDFMRLNVVNRKQKAVEIFNLKKKSCRINLYFEVTSPNQLIHKHHFLLRDFNGGVLGLAWIGDPGGVGGICDKQIQFGGVMKSLNSGIVSTLNYGEFGALILSQVWNRANFSTRCRYPIGHQCLPTLIRHDSGKCQEPQNARHEKMAPSRFGALFAPQMVVGRSP